MGGSRREKERRDPSKGKAGEAFSDVALMVVVVVVVVAAVAVKGSIPPFGRGRNGIGQDEDRCGFGRERH